MHTSTLLSSILVAGTALAAPTSPIFRRQQDCGYYPDQANQATSTFILRIEALSNGISNATTTNATLTNSTLPTTNGTTNSNATTTPNEILGYLDALSTSHGLVAPSKKFASQSFLAPTWNTNRVLLFWPAANSEAQEYERGFNIDQSALSSPESIAAVVSTPGCGTPFVELVAKYPEAVRGECGIAGQKVRAQTGCPAFGTGNNGNSHCTEQKFFLCDNTGLQGIADSQKAIYYGVAATAQYGQNCQEVDLVSECV